MRCHRAEGRGRDQADDRDRRQHAGRAGGDLGLVGLVERHDRDDAAGDRAADDEAPWLRLERERVQAALAKLPDREREALELAYYGGFTQSELAERLGQPLGTIKSRMFTGLARLRELLADPAAEKERWRTTPSTR